MATTAPTRVVAIIAAYNEDDVIGQVIADLIEQKLSVFLLDHRSTDRTRAEAERFLGRGLIGIERFPDESGFPERDGERFAWESLLRRKEELAVSLGFEWAMHVDADELRESPWRGVPLADAIGVVDRMGYNAIDFAVFHFRPTGAPFEAGTDLRRAFTHYDHPKSYDTLQIKCWKNVCRANLVDSGGHQAKFEGRRVFPIRFVLRHYPIRSQEHGVRKVFLERRPRFIESEHQRWHLQYDDVTEDTSFVRPKSELREWDADVVRAELAIRHRGVEQLEAELERCRRGQSG